jgi:hypothetical protein
MLLGRFQSSVLVNKVCTQYRMHSNCSEKDEACMYKLIFVHTMYEHCTNDVHTKYIHCMYTTWLKYIQCTSQYRIMHFVHTPYVLLTLDIDQYVLVCTDLY